MSDPWKLTCVGVLERIARHDIDKSGRNPKYKLELHIRPTEMQAELPGLTMPAYLRFGIMARDLPRLCKTPLLEGMRVSAAGDATGIVPVLIFLTHIAPADP